MGFFKKLFGKRDLEIDPAEELCEQCEYNWDAHLLKGFGDSPTEGWTGDVKSISFQFWGILVKITELLVSALILISVGISTPAFGQKSRLPGGLTKGSSLAEILTWLDKTSLPDARIGLESNASGPQPGEIPDNSTSYYESSIFAKGFRFAKNDGCKLTLRHENVSLLNFETKYPNPAEGSLDEFRKRDRAVSQYAAEFFIPLGKLKSNKAPFQHTKNAEKTALFGTWRTEFIRKFEFMIIPTRAKMVDFLENRMKIDVIGSRPDGENDTMTGDELTFTFDDKQMSEDFYSAFGRAIDLCKEK